jgi:hypothetical protein
LERLIRRFSRINIHRITQASMADAAEKAALLDMAMVYRGASEVGQRY